MTTLLWIVIGFAALFIASLIIILCGAARIGDEMEAEAWRRYVELKEREAERDETTQTLPTMPGDGSCS